MKVFKGIVNNIFLEVDEQLSTNCLDHEECIPLVKLTTTNNAKVRVELIGAYLINPHSKSPLG